MMIRKHLIRRGSGDLQKKIWKILYSRSIQPIKNTITIFLFYANWCMWTNGIISIFNILKNRHHNKLINDILIQFKKHETSDNEYKKYSIHSFPTILIKKNNNTSMNLYLEIKEVGKEFKLTFVDAFEHTIMKFVDSNFVFSKI